MIESHKDTFPIQTENQIKVIDDVICGIISGERRNAMEWIKTSEQLPPIGQPVLVTTNDWQFPYEIWEYKGKISVNDPTLDMWFTHGMGGITEEQPKAWMPLPQPYAE